MLEKTSRRINAVKDTVVDHRAKIAAVTTAAAFVALMARNAKTLNAFLDEHDLTDKYYRMGEFAEEF